MKRVVTVVVGAGLVLVIGCGTQNYEYRLEHTIDRMKYEKRLDDNLTEAVDQGEAGAAPDLRAPPQAMTGPTQTFQLAVIEPGKFDVESSFIEPEKQNLHVLARVKQPKTPDKKGAPKAEPPPRGDFNTEIVELLKNVYGLGRRPREIQGGERRAERGNTYKYQLLDLNAKNVQIYLYGTKNGPYEVGSDLRIPQDRTQFRQSQDRPLPGVVCHRREGQASLRGQ